MSPVAKPWTLTSTFSVRLRKYYRSLTEKVEVKVHGFATGDIPAKK